jgi:acetoin utilization protein AcuB
MTTLGSRRVREIMTPAPVTIAPEAPLAAALAVMRQHEIRHLPVVDLDGRFVGIVTDRDLRQVIFDPDIHAQLEAMPKALNILAVREVMTWGVISLRPDSDLREAARVMHTHKIGALPVVNHGRVVGILTESDVVKGFVDVLGEGVLSAPVRWGIEG